MLFRSALAGAALLAIAPAPAFSQEFPSRPVRMIVTTPAGSGVGPARASAWSGARRYRKARGRQQFAPRAVPADEDRFGRHVGRRPARKHRLQRARGVDTEEQCAERVARCTLAEDRHHERRMVGVAGAIAVEVGEAHAT